MKQALLVLLLLGVLVTRGIAADTDPVDMVRNPAAYNGRYVSVSGAMLNLRPATVGGIALPTATVFDLVAGPAILTVMWTVPVSCPMGSAVTVEGRFVQMRQIGPQFFANVIEAIRVNCR